MYKPKSNLNFGVKIFWLFLYKEKSPDYETIIVYSVPRRDETKTIFT